MTVRPLPADTLVQVTDTAGRVHAARIGPGVLCQATTAQEETPAVQTVAWSLGTDKVRCWECLDRMQALCTWPWSSCSSPEQRWSVSTARTLTTCGSTWREPPCSGFFVWILGSYVDRRLAELRSRP